MIGTIIVTFTVDLLQVGFVVMMLTILTAILHSKNPTTPSWLRTFSTLVFGFAVTWAGLAVGCLAVGWFG